MDRARDRSTVVDIARSRDGQTAIQDTAPLLHRPPIRPVQRGRPVSWLSPQDQEAPAQVRDEIERHFGPIDRTLASRLPTILRVLAQKKTRQSDLKPAM